MQAIKFDLWMKRKKRIIYYYMTFYVNFIPIHKIKDSLFFIQNHHL